MDERNHISEAKIKAFTVMGTVGIVVILIVDVHLESILSLLRIYVIDNAPQNHYSLDRLD